MKKEHLQKAQNSNPIQVGIRRLTSLTGVAAPILFVSLLSVLGYYRPGYSALTEPASNLAVGWNYGWVMDANFAISGILIVISSLGLYAIAIRKAFCRVDISLKIGTIFLVVSGASLAIESFNPTDIPGFPPATLDGTVHDISFFIIFFSMVFGPIIIGNRFRNLNGWRGFGAYSMVSGIATLGLILSFFFESANGSSIPPGLLQRILVAVALGWYAIMGLRVLLMGKTILARDKNALDTSYSNL